FPVHTVAINVAELDRFDSGATVDEAALRSSRLVQGRNVRIKVLGDGELSKPLNVSAHRFSKSAREKIEKAGGSVAIIAEASNAEAVSADGSDAEVAVSSGPLCRCSAVTPTFLGCPSCALASCSVWGFWSSTA